MAKTETKTPAPVDNKFSTVVVAAQKCLEQCKDWSAQAGAVTYALLAIAYAIKDLTRAIEGDNK